jgi:hypothetical protein
MGGKTMTRTILAAILTCSVVGIIAVAHVDAAKKSEKKSRGDDSSSNKSIQTQQDTAKSYSRSKRDPASDFTPESSPTSRPSDANSGPRSELAAAEQELRDLETSEAEALQPYRDAEKEAVDSGNKKQISKARKTLEKQQSGYDSKKTALRKRISDLQKKLDRSSSAPTSQPTRKTSERTSKSGKR